MALIPAEIKYLQAFADEVAKGNESVRDAARIAALLGCVLVSGTERVTEYVPTPAAEHRHYWHLHGDEWQDLLDGGVATYGTTLADVAIATALWGSYNSHAERVARCQPLTGVDGQQFGWVIDQQATADLYRTPLAAVRGTEFILLPDALQPGDKPLWRAAQPIPGDQGQEDLEVEVGVSVFARSELINAAQDPDNPLQGYIGLAELTPDWVRWPPQEPGAWMTDKVTRPVAILPVTGHDLSSNVMVCNFGPGDHDAIVRCLPPVTGDL